MATANGTPTDAWSQALQASADSSGSVSCRWTDLEIAITTSSTAPAADFEGHFVPARHSEPVTLKANARLWWRIAPTAQPGSPTGIYTIDAD